MGLLVFIPVVLVCISTLVMTASSSQPLLGAVGYHSVCKPKAGGVSMTSFPKGTVLLFQEGQWRTLCPGSLDTKGATIACRQWGYEKAKGISTTSEQTLATTGVSKITCTGREGSLADCSQTAPEASCAKDGAVVIECDAAAALAPPVGACAPGRLEAETPSAAMAAGAYAAIVPLAAIAVGIAAVALVAGRVGPASSDQGAPAFQQLL